MGDQTNRVVSAAAFPGNGSSTRKAQASVSECQTQPPVVMVGHFLWTGAEIVQQSFPDRKPNNFDFFLMFLVAGLVYMLACKELMLGCDNSAWADEWLALVHCNLAILPTLTVSSGAGVSTKGKFNNGHSKHKPRAPLCSPASVLHLCFP